MTERPALLDAPMTECSGGVHDLAHSSAHVVRGLRSRGVRAKVKISSVQIAPGPRPDAVRITTTSHVDGKWLSSTVTLALIAAADRCMFEYEGIQHARLHIERLSTATHSQGDVT